VRFQLLATPMTVLLKDRPEPERHVIISSVASKTMSFSTPVMLDGGRFTFPQEAYVDIGQSSRWTTSVDDTSRQFTPTHQFGPNRRHSGPQRTRDPLDPPNETL
jgi:hypothetical protein